MEKAKWLLTHHMEHWTRIKTLEHMRRALLRKPAVHDRDAMIESMMLSRLPPDGLPRGKGKRASRTESVALKLDEEVIRERTRDIDQIRQIDEELRTLRFYAVLYETVLCALTEKERTLIRLHYDKGYTLTQINHFLNASDNDQAISARSYASLKRMRQRVLQKAHAIISV